MTHAAFGRSGSVSLGAVVLLLIAMATTGLASDDSQTHPVVGRWSITSDAGGAVWAFLPSGALVVSGPGEIVSEGSWTATSGPDELDASVDVQVTGQQLAALAEVSPDGAEMALYVVATEATRPDDWRPWPAESRLVGERFGMIEEETPEPTPVPPDCLRPQWVAGQVDWDRCDEEPPTS
jgi:hypothetical protein